MADTSRPTLGIRSAWACLLRRILRPRSWNRPTIPQRCDNRTDRLLGFYEGKMTNVSNSTSEGADALEMERCLSPENGAFQGPSRATRCPVGKVTTWAPGCLRSPLDCPCGSPLGRLMRLWKLDTSGPARHRPSVPCRSDCGTARGPNPVARRRSERSLNLVPV